MTRNVYWVEDINDPSAEFESSLTTNKRDVEAEMKKLQKLFPERKLVILSIKSTHPAYNRAIRLLRNSRL